jgi:tetratricopeptide (TPR) repeat protein
MIFRKKKAIDWIKEGEKFLRKRKLDKAMECFRKAYDESDKDKNGFSPQRIKAMALDNMGVIYAIMGKYEEALDCFNKSLSLILAEKGINKDPLSEDTEVSDEVWLQIIRDPLAYVCYGDKATALSDLAMKNEGVKFDELIHQSRKIFDKLLRVIPPGIQHMHIATRLARARYDLIFAIAHRKYPEEFIQTDKGVICPLDRIREVYEELGYNKNEIMFDLKCAGLNQEP